MSSLRAWSLDTYSLLSSAASIDRKMIVELIERSGGRAASFGFRQQNRHYDYYRDCREMLIFS